MLDAFPTSHIGDLQTFSNFSGFYRIYNSGYPQSAAIFASQLTGHSSRNYVGGRITRDTLID